MPGSPARTPPRPTLQTSPSSHKRSHMSHPATSTSNLTAKSENASQNSIGANRTSLLMLANVPPFSISEQVQQVDGNNVYLAAAAANSPIEDVAFADSDSLLFGVADGHGGNECSQYTVSKLPAEMQIEHKPSTALERLEAMLFSGFLGSKSSSQPSNLTKDTSASVKPVEKAFSSAIAKIDKQYLEEGSRAAVCGSCLCAAHIEGRQLTVANVGDCRCIVAQRSNSGGSAWRVVQLTSEYVCSNEREKRAVAKRTKDPHPFGTSVNLSGPVRVAGLLMVTRAIGDGCLKREGMACTAQARYVPYITCEPQMTSVELTQEQALIVIASDGVWDALSNERAIELCVAAVINGKNAAKALVSAAIDECATQSGLSREEYLALPPGSSRRSICDDVSAAVWADSQAFKRWYGGHKRSISEGGRDAKRHRTR